MIYNTENIVQTLQQAQKGDVVYFDLDNTLLFTPIDKKSKGALVTEPELPLAIESLQARGVQIVYLTSRTIENSEIIKAQIRNLEYPDAEIIFAPNTDSRQTRDGQILSHFPSHEQDKPSKIIVVANDLALLQNISQGSTKDKDHHATRTTKALPSKVMLEKYKNHVYFYNYTPQTTQLLTEGHQDNLEFDLGSLANFKEVSRFGITNAYKVTLQDGRSYVLKHETERDSMQAEILALSTAYALGMPVPKSWYVNSIPEKLARKLSLKHTFGNFLVAKYIENIPDSEEKFTKEEEFARRYYVVQALLGNTDLLQERGANNIVSDRDNISAIDYGANFLFRAHVGKKTPTDEVPELDSLKDVRFNEYAAEVYRTISDDDIKRQVKEVQLNAEYAAAILTKLQENFPNLKEIATKFKDVLSSRIDSLSARVSPNTIYAKPNKRAKPLKTAAGILTIVYVKGEPYVLLGQRQGQQWWDNFGGSSEDNVDSNLLDTAMREVLEESSMELGLSSTHLSTKAPSHDLITLDKCGKTSFIYRMYIDVLNEKDKIDFSELKDDEHTNYQYLSLRELLNAIKLNKEIDEGRYRTIQVGDSKIKIFPPLYDMLRQNAVYANLRRLLKNTPERAGNQKKEPNTLKQGHTQDHKSCGESVDESPLGARKLLRTVSSSDEERQQKVTTIINHQEVIRELKKLSEEPKVRDQINIDQEKLSPSLLYLRELLGDNFDIQNLRSTVNKAVTEHIPNVTLKPEEAQTLTDNLLEFIKIEESAPNKLPMYHGCDSKTSFVYAVCSEFMKTMQMDSSWDALRARLEPFLSFANMTALIETFSEGGTKPINNYASGFSDVAISVNVAFSGNHGNHTSNSLTYYKENKISNNFKLAELLRSIFSPLGVKPQSIKKLLFIFEKYREKKAGVFIKY